MTCAFCGRSDIEIATDSIRLDIPTRTWPLHALLELHHGGQMCIDCANVTSYFIRQGATAFGKELERHRHSSRQLTFEFMEALKRTQNESATERFLRDLGFRISGE